MTAPVEWIERDMARYEREFISRGLPGYMWEGIRHHVSVGEPTGHFLTALLSNNMADVVSHGDDNNMALLKVWVLYLYNVLPSGCWGTGDKCQAWRKSGGLYGIDAKAEKEKG